jgi:hydrogenase nickel incorporation protein HypB
MCDECGCSDHDIITVDKPVFEANDVLAHQNGHILKEKEVFCVNVMGSPGSGKTTVIEGLADALGAGNIAVIQGDLESDVDKKRLELRGIAAHQINTHSGCHLNASMVNRALMELPLSGKKYLFIENVGNLVCPAGVKLGQHLDLVVSSTAEGSDKPQKYPIIFMEAGLVVISKIDLMSFVDFDEEEFKKDVFKVNPKVKIVKVSRDGSSDEIAHLLGHRREHLLGIGHTH